MNIAIVVPVYNDWESLALLLRHIDARTTRPGEDVDVIIVDDASTLPRPPRAPWNPLPNVKQIWIVELTCNVGHQRAIAIGLAHVNRLNAHDVVIVMDGDGEDRPEDLSALVEIHRERPDAIVVAQRAQRSEGIYFSTFYFLYRIMFRSMTGQYIDFGNFCLIPKLHVTRLVYMPELWSHLAAAILRSRVPVHRLKTMRGSRYAGRSSMNVISLIAHGLSAMAIFSDLLFVRILIFSLIVAVAASAVAVIAVALRLYSDLAIPGWATTVIGIAVVVIVQGLTLSMIAAFITLTNRNNLPLVPAVNGPAFIRNTEKMIPNVN